MSIGESCILLVEVLKNQTCGCRTANWAHGVQIGTVFAQKLSIRYPFPWCNSKRTKYLKWICTMPFIRKTPGVDLTICAILIISYLKFTEQKLVNDFFVNVVTLYLTLCHFLHDKYVKNWAVSTILLNDFDNSYYLLWNVLYVWYYRKVYLKCQRYTMKLQN